MSLLLAYTGEEYMVVTPGIGEVIIDIHWGRIHGSHTRKFIIGLSLNLENSSSVVIEHHLNLFNYLGKLSKTVCALCTVHQIT